MSVHEMEERPRSSLEPSSILKPAPIQSFKAWKLSEPSESKSTGGLRLGDFSRLQLASLSGTIPAEPITIKPILRSTKVRRKLDRGRGCVKTQSKENEHSTSPPEPRLGDFDRLFAVFQQRSIHKHGKLQKTKGEKHLSKVIPKRQSSAINSIDRSLEKAYYGSALRPGTTATPGLYNFSTAHLQNPETPYDSDDTITPLTSPLVAPRYLHSASPTVSLDQLVPAIVPSRWGYFTNIYNDAPSPANPYTYSTELDCYLPTGGQYLAVKIRPRQLILEYSLRKSGQTKAIHDTARTQDQAYESLRANLVPFRKMDRHVAKRQPQLTHNGVHVFLDVSNIFLSYLQTLREIYHLPDNARFSPLPKLNFEYLTEILLRGRKAKGKFAGCSYIPGQSVPAYVLELKYLDYEVDVHERQRVEEPILTSTRGSGYKQKRASGEAIHVRYVEELVDETLHARIDESCRRRNHKKGTLVIATGDGRPAPQSPGFFAYATWALEMGWNVEVVSWSCSLSGNWSDPAFLQKWGDQFRLISLDSMAKELLQWVWT